MKIDFELFNRAKRQAPEELISADRTLLLRSLLAWLDSWRHASYVDDEALCEAGILIARAKHQQIDRDVMRWQMQAHSKDRLGITSDFLRGYWRRSAYVDAPAIESLLQLLSTLERASTVHGCVLTALHAVVASRPQRLSAKQQHQVRSILLCHLDDLEEHQESPGITASLKSLR